MRHLLIVCPLALLACNERPLHTPYPPPSLELVSGSIGGPGYANGSGAEARFNSASGIASDGAGHLFVTDVQNRVLRRVDVGSAAVTTLAGKIGQQGTDDGVGTDATFWDPNIVVWESGALFLYEATRIRKVDPATTRVTTIVTGLPNSVLPMVGDGRGHLYLLDGIDSAILSVDLATNTLSTVHKLTGDELFASNLAAVGSRIFVVFPDSLRTFDPSTGALTKVALGSQKISPGTSTSDGQGRLWTTDGSLVTELSLDDDSVQPLAGQASWSSHGQAVDGAGQNASFLAAGGIAYDRGQLYVADRDSIRHIDPQTGVVSTLAGAFRSSVYVDGPAADARFIDSPVGLTLVGADRLYIADQSMIRLLSLRENAVSTVAGATPDVGAKDPALRDGTGSDARMFSVSGLTSDGASLLYFSDTTAVCALALDTMTAVTTIAGHQGNAGSDGVGPAAGFEGAAGIVYDGAGNLYLADRGTSSLRKVEIASGTVTTVAGKLMEPGTADGVGAAARLTFPFGLVRDGSGVLYFTDLQAHTIRRFDPSPGAVTTIAGGAMKADFADGVGAAARFSSPAGLALDIDGALIVGESGNHTVRRISLPDATVTTLAKPPTTEARTSSSACCRPGCSAPSTVGVLPNGDILVTDGDAPARATPSPPLIRRARAAAFFAPAPAPGGPPPPPGR